MFFNSRSSSVIIETGKRRRRRALRAHRRGLLLLLEPLEELDARLGLDLLAGLAADLLGVGRRADLARAVDLRAVDGGDEALEPELAVDDLGLAAIGVLQLALKLSMHVCDKMMQIRRVTAVVSTSHVINSGGCSWLWHTTPGKLPATQSTKRTLHYSAWDCACTACGPI